MNCTSFQNGNINSHRTWKQGKTVFHMIFGEEWEWGWGDLMLIPSPSPHPKFYFFISLSARLFYYNN